MLCRNLNLESLRSALTNHQSVKTKVMYHVSLPLECAHTTHKCGNANYPVLTGSQKTFVDLTN